MGRTGFIGDNMIELNNPHLAEAASEDNLVRYYLAQLNSTQNLKDFDSIAYRCTYHFFKMLDSMRAYYKENHKMEDIL